MINKPKKRIAVVDADMSIVEPILEFIKDQYSIELTKDKAADYVIHSVGGYDVLQYSGVRIFVAGENVSPNFMISDYALTFEKMVFGDRYVWLPLIKLYREAYSALTSPRQPVDSILTTKTDFCAYVMSNTSNSASERSEIFDLLSAYKTVNSGGLWRNNVGGRVPNKRLFQLKHKFVIAFENCSHPGYLTEKFADAAASNAVPIYWGDPEIASIFNHEAFINCHDFPSLEAVVQRVQEIDQNESLYRKMLSEPWFPNGVEPSNLKDATFANFLAHIFNQDLEKAYRRNRGRWGRKKERQLYEMWAKPHRQGLRILRKKWLSLYHSIFPHRKKY